MSERCPGVLPPKPGGESRCDEPSGSADPTRPFLSILTPHCMRHTISVLVENKFGVLARVSGMFSGRGFNIDTLNVAPTHDATLSRITVVLKGDDAALDMVTKQLRKLVNVVEVVDFTEGQAVQREMLLAKVKADSKSRSEIMQICDIFRAKIVNVAHDSVIVEITGDEGKIAAFLKLIEAFGILELARTGQLALKR
jgi:acetolactate synthase-1/3 small subunit